MDTPLLIPLVRVAGALHLVTLVGAVATPIPPDWDENLERLPPLHRRFSLAQNISVGATTAFLGLVSCLHAPLLVDGSPGARLLSAATACWWGGRLLIIPWIGIHTALTSRWLKIGFALLLAQCASYAVAYGWLALR